MQVMVSFDDGDPKEKMDFEMLKSKMGLGDDWAAYILRVFLYSIKDNQRIGDCPFSWDDVDDFSMRYEDI